MKHTAIFASMLLVSAFVGGGVQASPLTKHSTTTGQASNMRLAAGEKREVEGTKADAREDKAEAAAQAANTSARHKKTKHRTHKAATTHM